MTPALGWKRSGITLMLWALVGLFALPQLASAVATGDTFVSDGVTYKVWSDEYAAVGDGIHAAVPQDSREVMIPAEVSTEGATYSVLAIGDSAFDRCSSLTSITIPGSVQGIMDSAFYGCSSLTSITLPSSVIMIDRRAFWFCSSLATINIPDTVVSIGDEAFGYCSSLTSVTIPPGVTSMGRAVFADCSSLTAATIPTSITSVPSSTFSGCSSLVTYIVPPGITSIGGYAFYECSSLSTITIPTSVTSIGDSAFARCRALASIRIPDTVSVIRGSTFRECLSLASVTIPDSVTFFDQAAFWGCSSLATITIPGSVTAIDDIAFEDCTSLRSIIIPGSVASIGGGAFAGCSSLATAVLDVNRPLIGLYAFPPSTRILTNISSATIGGLAANYACTGSAIQPVPVVTLAGRILTPNDYDVSYANNVNVGTGTLIITGKNDYAGTVTKGFPVGRRAVLSRRATRQPLLRSGIYYARGFISPWHSIDDANKVTIRVYKRDSDGTYHYVTSTAASYLYYSSTKTRYQAVVKLPSKGAWKLVAYHRTDSRNTASYGPPDYVVVQ